MRSAFCEVLLSRIKPLANTFFTAKDGNGIGQMKSIGYLSYLSRVNRPNTKLADKNKKKVKHALSATSVRSYSKTAKTRIRETDGKSKNDSGKSELLIMPGVGEKNAALLTAKGLDTVESIKSVFMEKFDKEPTPFIEYLHQEVGIRHKVHCQKIAGYFSNNVEDNGRILKVNSQDRVTISIEGNISAGKTSFLNYLSDTSCEIHDLCEFVREPVDMWLRVNELEGYNMLERFYNHPKKYAYEFQNYVFLSRYRQNRETVSGDKPLRMIERSVFSDRLVFVRAVHEARFMDDFQLQVYDSWFNPLLQDTPGLVPDGFIYLRANPETCMRRLRRRGRIEESNVSKEYLEGIHSKHEDWFDQSSWTKKTSILHHASSPPISQFSARTCLDGVPPLPRELEGSIVWLGSSGILSSHTPRGTNNGINGHGYPAPLPKEVIAAVSDVPALVLDYDDDFDVENDLAMKKHYAKTVKAFFDYVKLYHRKDRRFYSDDDSEKFRRKWDIVNSVSEEELIRFMKKKREEKEEPRDRMLSLV